MSIPIIWAMSERRPNLDSLWLGATTTGLLPRLFQISRSFLPKVYLEAVTWTRSPQSFMDPSNHRPVRSHRIGDLDMIPREDEFRLLFLTDIQSDTWKSTALSLPSIWLGESPRYCTAGQTAFVLQSQASISLLEVEVPKRASAKRLWKPERINVAQYAAGQFAIVYLAGYRSRLRKLIQKVPLDSQHAAFGK